MTPFLVGFVFGAAFVACGFVIFFTRKKTEPVPEPWTEEYHRIPPVTTTILVNKRKIEI